MVDVRRLSVGEDNEIVAVTLDDLAGEGARRMIATALQAEVTSYVERFADEVDEDGKRLVVRNGRARERKITIGAGTLAIRAPRVNNKRVDEQTGGAPTPLVGDLARRTRAGHRGSTTCCRCCTCAASRPATFARRSSSCSARTPPACRRRRSAGRARTGRPSTPAFAPARCAFTSTPTCSLTASTSRCAWARTTACACWS